MKKLKEKIGLIGCGNMGAAILEGLLKNKIAKPRQIFMFDPIPEKLKLLSKKFSVRICRNNDEVIRQSQIVILAVKPQELAVISKGLRGAFKNQALITILAGTPISKVRRFLGSKIAIARAMPNLGAKVGSAITALCGDARAIRKAELIFSGCGETVRVAEKQFDVVTAVSGSGPAYFFLLMELLANFAETHGFSKESAKRLSVQTALGAAKLAKLSSENPEALRKQVTSKGGTTEAALSFLFKKKAPEIFGQAFLQAVRRAKALSRD